MNKPILFLGVLTFPEFCKIAQKLNPAKGFIDPIPNQCLHDLYESGFTLLRVGNRSFGVKMAYTDVDGDKIKVTLSVLTEGNSTEYVTNKLQTLENEPGSINNKINKG